MSDFDARIKAARNKNENKIAEHIKWPGDNAKPAPRVDVNLGIFGLEVIQGDFGGMASIEHGVLWLGPRADKFHGIRFSEDGNPFYAPDAIARMKYLQKDGPSVHGTLSSSAAGGLFFGVFGALAGGAMAAEGSAKKFVGIEFSDGKKAVVEVNGRDKAFECLELYMKETKKFDYGFEF